ncbi:MFS transporter [Streptomyces sp. LBUM 1476]|nr:MFS transporter [Streptomyces sp. LBUM 1476]MBZ3915965.1 MFS transporter [Streptomyces acidiscabies]
MAGGEGPELAGGLNTRIAVAVVELAALHDAIEAPFALGAAADGPPWARAATLSVSLFLSFFGVMLFDVNLNSLQAAAVPDGMRARVSGAYSTVNYGVRPLGALAGGALASAVGLRTTLIVAGVGGALSVLWLLPSPIPRTREPQAAHATPAPDNAMDHNTRAAP